MSLSKIIGNGVIMTAAKQVAMHTDGGCLGNPGPGGYGVVLKWNAHRRELSGGFRLTTNNRMELMAVISGLRALKGRCHVTIYSDSQYVVNGIKLGWAKSWRARGWRKADRKPAENVDLWQALLELIERHEAKLVWVRGHAGNLENERCDELAMAQAERAPSASDEVYENTRAREED